MNADDPFTKDELNRSFLAAQAELKEHAHDPLNTKLECWVQPLTLERLNRWHGEHPSTSIDVYVNTALVSVL